MDKRTNKKKDGYPSFFLSGAAGGIYPAGINFESPPIRNRGGAVGVPLFLGAAGGIRTHVDCSKLISSQPRYDHFDTAAYLLLPVSASIIPHFAALCNAKIKFFAKNVILFLTSLYSYVIITKLTISTEGACGCSTMARAPAFQAGDAGSIPVTRSNLFICASSSVG